MDRRTVLASLVGGTALVTGVSVHRRLSSEPDSRETPEIPNPLTAENVVEFVTDYESATYHNTILDGSSYDELNVGCRTRFDRQIQDSFYALTLCGGTGYAGDDISDFVDYEVAYRVTEERVERSVREGGRSGSGSGTLKLFNFTDERHPLTVAVTSSDASTVFEGAFELDATVGTNRYVDDIHPHETYTISAQSSVTAEETETELTPDTEIIIYITTPDAIEINTIDIDTTTE